MTEDAEAKIALLLGSLTVAIIFTFIFLFFYLIMYVKKKVKEYENKKK